MGWTSFNMRGNAREWFKDQWNYKDSDYEVIDCALVQRQTIYGALKQKSTGEVFCVVYLIRYGRGYYNFTYKDMTEHSGPGVIDCPERIFKLLTPLTDTPDNEYAIKWRARVEKLYTKRKLLKGNVIFETKEPCAFTGGSSFSQFKKEGKRIYAGKMVNGQFETYCRVYMHPLNYEFKII